MSKRWYEKAQEAIRTGKSVHIGSVNREKRQLELSQGVSDGVEFPKHYTLKEEASRNAVPTLLFASHPQGVSTIDSEFTVRGQGYEVACICCSGHAYEAVN